MINTTNKYKYHLDTSSRKYPCPKCGRKTFVLYLDDAGQSLSDEVGKCDRKDKCQHHYTPSEFFKDNDWRNSGNKKSNREKNMNSRPEIIKPDFIPSDVFLSTIKGYQQNSLMRYLHSIYDAKIGLENVNNIAISYGMGTSNMFGGSPIFWQIDAFGNVRAGKIMGYDSLGKRVKTPVNQIQWVHTLPAIKESSPNFKLQQCYFGSHRLISAEKECGNIVKECETIKQPNSVTPIVGLFESEKASLIIAMALEWVGCANLFIPVACGGCDNFKTDIESKRDPYNKLQILRNRKVVIFPDEGKYNDWLAKARGLLGFASEVYVSSVMEKGIHEYSVNCAIEEGDALDDVVLRYINRDASPGEVSNLILTSWKDKLNV